MAGSVGIDELAAREFERHRPRLLGIAYRLLGSMWDAEDVVEEALLRWLRTDRSEVREPVAFLTTVVSRLALDQLKSARVQREAYSGPWLPEPALTDSAPFGPLETVEQRDSLSIATLRLMERLTPPERAVFVMRTAFGLPYDDIAGMLELTSAQARQLFHRAQARVTEERGQSVPDVHEHRRLLELFLEAATNGDLAQLEQLLADDVVSYNDGGGKARAAPRPVTGIGHVLRFIGGLLKKYPLSDVRVVQANGLPAAMLSMGDQGQLVALDVQAGKIREILTILNPDKLSYVEHQLS